ncbi:hypothetical protein EDD93_6548 [Streptomyces sp. 840.1]|nr:hypothetical protein EDD93_6548 [Streptomyces sp. 840.1]
MHEACDLLIGETLAVEVSCGHEWPEPFIPGDRCLHACPAVRPGGDKRLAVSRNTGADENHAIQPFTELLRGLTDRDARVAVTDQDDVPQIPAFDLGNDALDVGLLPRRHAPLVSETGQRQRPSAVAGRV